ncbi:MAG: phosphotransferase [Anaerolineales bacterium]|jgi:CheY-like chemotaxis protein|nr:phosphotransferase [Anaerolineales bacterium]
MMPSQRKRILFVENQPDKIDALLWYLRDRGYIVEVIVSLPEARKALTRGWWPLAVIDVRLIDDLDDQDFSGLDLVTRQSDRSICKIILTSYPSPQAMRAALVHYPDQLPPAVDFISKLDPGETVVQQIIDALEHRSGINWNLEVNGLTVYQEMAAWLSANPADPAFQPGSAADMELECADLLGKLLPGRRMVTFLPAPQGRSNARLGFARPTSQSEEALLAIKLGWRDEISQEQWNYTHFVKNFAGREKTTLEAYAETVHFAALAYSFVGSRLEETIRFTDYFTTHTLEQVIHALHEILDVCTPLYELPADSIAERLDEIYRARMRLGSRTKGNRLRENLLKLADQADQLGFTALKEAGEMRFQWPGGLELSSLTLKRWILNPDQMAAPESCLFIPVEKGVVHGDLNGDNALIDPDGRAWLIDFGRTGYGYRLADFAELESVIALDILTSSDSLPRRAFEEALFSQQKWQAALQSHTEPLLGLSDPELIKALGVIQELRRCAASYERDQGCLKRYYLALFFEAALRLMMEDRGLQLAQPTYPTGQANALLRCAILIRELSKEEGHHEKTLP